MMQKPISDAEAVKAVAAPLKAGDGRAIPIRVAIVTLDSHMASATDRARGLLQAEYPGLDLTLHAVSEWAGDEMAAERCRRDVAAADIVIANMIFMEEHSRAIAPWLEARRADCDAMVCCMSAAEVVKKTRLGEFDMDKPAKGIIGLLKSLRGKGKSATAGRRQMATLRTLPKIL